MRRELMIVLIIVLITGLAGCVEKKSGNQPVNTEAVRKAVQQQNEKFMETFNNGNMEAFSTLFVNESGAMMPPGQDMVMGRDSIMKFMNNVRNTGVNRIELSTREFYPHQDYAVEVGDFKIFVSDTQQVDHGKYMAYWKKSDGKWRIYRDIWSSNQATD